MLTKILEIRDEGTYFAVLAVNMNPGPAVPDDYSDYGARLYHLRRVGYPCDGRPNIGITHLSADGKPFWNDPYGWGGRTYPVAHNYIIENWETLRDGDVIDVRYILHEVDKPATSERFEIVKTD
jgi:hypothetical protein